MTTLNPHNIDTEPQADSSISEADVVFNVLVDRLQDRGLTVPLGFNVYKLRDIAVYDSLSLLSTGFDIRQSETVANRYYRCRQTGLSIPRLEAPSQTTLNAVDRYTVLRPSLVNINGSAYAEGQHLLEELPLTYDPSERLVKCVKVVDGNATIDYSQTPFQDFPILKPLIEYLKTED